MSKATDELYAYRERKMHRQIDYANNMQLMLDIGNYEQANIYMQKANELDAEVKVIEQCIKIVRDNEQPKTYKRMVGRKIVEEPWPPK